MSNIKEIIVNAVMPALKAVGEIQMVAVFKAFGANNSPETYEKFLKGLHADFVLLDTVAVKTKTKVDDGIVDIVLNAVKDCADEIGLVLE